VQIGEAYALIDHGEVWLHGMHVAPYTHAQTHSGHDPDRKRKLLLHASEIEQLRARVDEQRLSLVPLALYFKEGRAKVELALARGRKAYDKRQVLAERDAQREADRAIARAGRE
jgi:SsrA-binding protein